jgi:DNA-binding GntR family transcriptional regulator
MPIPGDVNTVKRSLLREEIYEKLQGWILVGALQPGEQLRDTDLSVRLGVSRTPVREALRMLEDEGLVETASGRWTRVSSVTLREAKELYPAVWTLERHLVEDAIVHFTREHARVMEAENITLGRGLRNGDMGLAAQADAAFHRVIQQASGNTTVSGLLESLSKKVGRFLHREKPEASHIDDVLDEHATIIETLNTRNSPRAGKAVLRHWQASLSRLEAQWMGNAEHESVAKTSS